MASLPPCVKDVRAIDSKRRTMAGASFESRNTWFVKCDAFGKNGCAYADALVESIKILFIRYCPAWNR